ncbi:MAG: hypothetical protein VXY98_01865, partial [Pseudomonadota bacterium]|nr:hypothetical protein [Pseudomonadota bacterium]
DSWRWQARGSYLGMGFVRGRLPHATLFPQVGLWKLETAVGLRTVSRALSVASVRIADTGLVR